MGIIERNIVSISTIKNSIGDIHSRQKWQWLDSACWEINEKYFVLIKEQEK